MQRDQECLGMEEMVSGQGSQQGVVQKPLGSRGIFKYQGESGGQRGVTWHRGAGTAGGGTQPQSSPSQALARLCDRAGPGTGKPGWAQGEHDRPHGYCYGACIAAEQPIRWDRGRGIHQALLPMGRGLASCHQTQAPAILLRSN